jgi:hypothetical protein
VELCNWVNLLGQTYRGAETADVQMNQITQKQFTVRKVQDTTTSRAAKPSVTAQKPVS